MLPFSSIDFFVVIAIIIAILYSIKFFFKNIISFWSVLTSLSFIFLIAYFPKPLYVIIFILYSFGLTLLFQKFKGKYRFWGVILLLLPMIFVKLNIKVHYYPYNLSTWISFAGLSYISFRTLSVFLDIVKTNQKLPFFKYVGYLLFTPTLLIGPIDRFSRFSQDLLGGWEQLNTKRFISGWESLILGILYKYVFAEITMRYILNATDVSSLELSQLALNMYGYYLYLFFDFAGYSAMAIGIGKMMGIDVPINFNMPFLARNPQDFWQRFHKTLGDWLNSYFFSPLYMYFSKRKSLKKHPLFRQNIAIVLTFLLMGMWNGFTKNFIISGLIFGLYSLTYNSYLHYSRKKQRDIIFGTLPDKYVRIISIFIMFHLAAFSIYIFSGRAPFI